MIDRIRLTAAAKNQLVTIKRKTGIEHYNTICRHALCLSLANPSQAPIETFNFAGGIEIDWRTLTSGNEELYLNILLIRLLNDGEVVNAENIKQALGRHIHRGLSYLASGGEDEAALALGKRLLQRNK